MILYRPVGLKELRLIYESGLKAFPPRLPEQPIFYPVLNLEYARQIAEEWNATREPYAGYVTRFAVDDDYAGQFERHVVGGSEHQELWVPSEQLVGFNRHLDGLIGVVEAFFGDSFRGEIPTEFGFRDLDAVSQFVSLCSTLEWSRMDFHLLIVINHITVFLNYPFWLKRDFSDQGIDETRRLTTLAAIRESWAKSSLETPLVVAYP